MGFLRWSVYESETFFSDVSMNLLLFLITFSHLCTLGIWEQILEIEILMDLHVCACVCMTAISITAKEIIKETTNLVFYDAT